MRQLHRLAILCFSLSVSSCSDTDEDLPESDVAVEQVEDVFVFFHADSASPQALHIGKATVRNDCLYVEDAIVLWPEFARKDVEELLVKLKNGEAPTVKLGGGAYGGPEDPTKKIPSDIADRCDTDMLWFASSGIEYMQV